MKTNIKTLSFVGVTTLMLCFVACKKSTPPTVKIYDNAISVSYTSANVTGEVTDEGSSPVTDRGFVYGKQGEARQDTMYCGNGAGEFPTRLTNLEPNTTYNCMAFARNDAGTTYSGKATFTTLPMAQSDITTSEPTDIGHTHATCGGYVNSDGGSEVTERGVCWATTLNPTTIDSHLNNGTGTGEFSINITGLTANTTYHIRAYAVNSKGTSYGDDVTFKTLDYTTPTVITGEVIETTNTTAICGGKVSSGGGLTVTARGVCWSRTNENPTISDSHTTDGTGTGEFTSNITGLTANNTYYVRAYATNSKGTSYGERKTFKAQDAPIGGINGKFSVGGKQVWFSQGNLQYKANTGTWRFAEHQYDYIGYDNSNISSTYSGWIDMFGWGTGDNPTCTDGYFHSSESFHDWGKNVISNGGNIANKWHTLTKGEWEYVLYTRSTSSGIRYAKAQVNYVNGLILLPDDWSTSYYSLNNTNPGDWVSYDSNVISLSVWTNNLETHGAVFLPSAGERNKTEVHDVGSKGYYWTSTYRYDQYGQDNAFFLYITNSLVGDGYTFGLYSGSSVRLVSDVK